ELAHPPKIFGVNWFRRDAEGRFLWPGFGENMRVLKWVIDRVHGHRPAVESALGRMPHYEDLDWRGLEDFSREEFNRLMSIDREVWKKEVHSQDELFSELYDKLPKEFIFMRELLLSSLWRSPKHWGLAPERM
ncbi:MAG: phosphoenolpyruvate carboxykinase (GTP), partial [Thioalkalivibrio sp.]|nr:phosphoenolpyruvate carboxykinase (GTP) [Thioalkalivibrio sp.]